MILSLKKEGRTIIITSHHQEDIDILCDKVYEMDAGKITTKGCNNKQNGANTRD